MKSKTTNNLSRNFTMDELSILAGSKQNRPLSDPCLLVLHLDKRTVTKKAGESYPIRRISSYCISITDNIFRQPNVSKFTLHNTSRSKNYTYFAEGKLSNLSVIFTVDTTEKDSIYTHSTYRVEFKDKESLLHGLQVYTVLVTQSKDKIIRRKLRAYFTALALL